MSMTDDPNEWMPHHSPSQSGRPEPGVLLGWRYATWRVLECFLRAEVDWSEQDRHNMQRMADWEAHLRRPPYVLVLQHERGPKLVTNISADGRVHVGVPAGVYRSWHVMREPYPVCSCHGEPWPCREEIRDQVATREAKNLEGLLAGLAPGLCAHCAKPIGPRAKPVTFPEPHAEVPGSPGPTFHLRGECRWAAMGYEAGPRLAAHPGAERLVTCTGQAFQHEEGNRLDCSAGPACTGHHGRGGHWCGTSVFEGLGPNDWIRPATRCSFSDCTGVSVAVQRRRVEGVPQGRDGR